VAIKHRPKQNFAPNVVSLFRLPFVNLFALNVIPPYPLRLLFALHAMKNISIAAIAVVLFHLPQGFAPSANY
jgi:hypothetical protein